MKRQLSLVLALVMILGSFSAVFAAEMPVTQVEKANFLKEVKVLEGNKEGDLNLEQDLKRRDALVVLSRLFDKEEAAKAYPSEKLTFTDLTDDFYNGFIAWALDEGYAKGKVEGVTFDPNGPLTTQAFATMTLRALGYEENGSDVFKEAYKIAKDLGILEGVEVEEKDTVTRGDMAAMTYNALGVVVKGGTKTLAETLNIVMPEEPAAKELKIEKVYTENLAEMEIELSNAKLADKAKLENESNYTIVGPNSEKVKVYKAEVIENNVRLTLVPYGRTDKTETVKPLLKDRNYSLTIRNIDKVINEKTIRNILAVDNAIPTVESVEFMGTYGIKVVTSEPIKDAQERFFTVDNTRTSMFVEQFGRTLILTPYLSASFDKDAKELTIGKLEDFAGFTATEQKFDLNLAEEDVKPVVKNVYRSGSVLTVEFEEDIFHKSIEGYETRRDLGNVTFKDGRVNFYAKADPVKVNETTVVYTFEREIPRNVEVEISGIQNHFGTEMDVVSMMPELLRDEAIPYIIDPVARMNTLVYKAGSYNATNKTADVEMEITFDKEDMTGFVDVNGNVKVADLKEHFELYEIEIASRNIVSSLITSARVDKDKVFVTFTGVKVQNLNNDNDYILEVKRFSDKAGNRMETSYIDFEVRDAAAAFNVTEISVRQSTEYSYASEIVMTFNRPLDKEEAEKVNNFYLGKNGTTRAVRAYLEKDGKTVSLLMRDRTVEQVKALELLEISSNVKESSKRFTVQNRFWNLKTGEFVKVELEEEVSAITYINDNTGYATPATAAENAVTVTLDANNKYNYKVVAFEEDGITPIVLTAKEGKTSFNVSLAELGLSNVNTKDEKVIVKVYKSQTEDKKDYTLVDTKTIYTKDMRAASLGSATKIGSDLTAAKATIGGVNFEAVVAGAAGNNLEVVIVDGSGNNVPTSITFANSKLTVTRSTDGSEAVQNDTAAAIQAVIDADADAKAAIKATGGTATATATATNLTGGLDKVAPKVTLTFTGADLKVENTTISMVIGGTNYAGLTAEVKNATTVEVTGFADTATIYSDLTGNITSVVGLETVNGVITDITGTPSL